MSQRSNSFHSQSLNNTCSSIISAQTAAAAAAAAGNAGTTTTLGSSSGTGGSISNAAGGTPRYPLVVSFRKIPSRDNGSIRLASTRQPLAANNNDYERMRSRTNTFDGIYLSPVRPEVCYSINEPSYYKEMYNSPRRFQQHQQQRQPLIGLNNLTTTTTPTTGKYFPVATIATQYGKYARCIWSEPHHPSPYDSPELSIETRRFQDNLNSILKDLVFKGGALDYDTHQTQLVERWLRHNKITTDTKFEKSGSLRGGGISKSTSMPCFFRT